jgi:hypothetical protein
MRNRAWRTLLFERSPNKCHPFSYRATIVVFIGTESEGYNRILPAVNVASPQQVISSAAVKMQSSTPTLKANEKNRCVGFKNSPALFCVM